MTPEEITIQAYVDARVEDLGTLVTTTRADLGQQIREVRRDVLDMRKESAADHAAVQARLAELVERLAELDTTDQTQARVDKEMERRRAVLRAWVAVLATVVGAAVAVASLALVAPGA